MGSIWTGPYGCFYRILNSQRASRQCTAEHSLHSTTKKWPRHSRFLSYFHGPCLRRQKIQLSPRNQKKLVRFMDNNNTVNQNCPIDSILSCPSKQRIAEKSIRFEWKGFTCAWASPTEKGPMGLRSVQCAEQMYLGWTRAYVTLHTLGWRQTKMGDIKNAKFGIRADSDPLDPTPSLIKLVSYQKLA